MKLSYIGLDTPLKGFRTNTVCYETPIGLIVSLSSNGNDWDITLSNIVDLSYSLVTFDFGYCNLSKQLKREFISCANIKLNA